MNARQRPFQFKLIHLLLVMFGVGVWLGIYRLGLPYDCILVGVSTFAIGPVIWLVGWRKQNDGLAFVGMMLLFASPLLATITVGIAAMFHM